MSGVVCDVDTCVCGGGRHATAELLRKDLRRRSPDDNVIIMIRQETAAARCRWLRAAGRSGSFVVWSCYFVIVSYFTCHACMVVRLR